MGIIRVNGVMTHHSSEFSLSVINGEINYVGEFESVVHEHIYDDVLNIFYKNYKKAIIKLTERNERENSKLF